MAELPSWPKALENDTWQKNKGTIAKIATSGDGTGIGDKLKKLKTEFHKVTWDNFETGHVLKGYRRSQWNETVRQEFVDSCKSELAKTAEARKAVELVQTEAEKVAKDWAKSKLIPKSSTTAATNVAKAAEALGKLMKPASIQAWIDEQVDYIDKEIEKIRKQGAGAEADAKRLADNIIKLAPGIAKSASDTEKQAMQGKKTVWQVEWDAFWSENIRALGTKLPFVYAGNPGLEKYKPLFLKICSNGATPADETELKKRVTEVDAMAKKVKAELK